MPDLDPTNGLCNVSVMLCNCPFRYLRSTLHQRIMKLLTEIMDRKQSFLYLQVWSAHSSWWKLWMLLEQKPIALYLMAHSQNSQMHVRDSSSDNKRAINCTKVKNLCYSIWIFITLYFYMSCQWICIPSLKMFKNWQEQNFPSADIFVRICDF